MSLKIVPVEEQDYLKIQSFLSSEDRALQIGYIDPPSVGEMKRYLYPTGRSYKFEVEGQIKGVVKVLDGLTKFCAFTLRHLFAEPNVIQEALKKLRRMASARSQKWMEIIDVLGYSKELIDELKEFGFNISKSFSGRYFGWRTL